MMKSKLIVGRNARVDFGKRVVGVPAKIDTGADGSSVWATNIRVDKDGVLLFSLFGEGSPYYNGKVFKRTNYSAVVVKSSSGHKTLKYRTHFSIKIAGKKIKTLFALSDRSSHIYPILIGRRTLSGKFLVDVSLSEVKMNDKPVNTGLNKRLQADPVAFHKKYYQEKEYD